jgi:hypothetical protein
MIAATPVLIFAVAILAGLAAPLLVAAYHRFVVYCFKKTGVALPDNAAVDSQIVAVTKALLPELLREALARKLDPVALEKIIEDALKASGTTPLMSLGDRARFTEALKVGIQTQIPYDPTKSERK